MYRVSHEEITLFWEFIVSVIVSKKVYMYMCPIPNSFRDRAISLYTVQTSNTPCPHELQGELLLTVEFSRKCIILGKPYQLYHLNSKYRYYYYYYILTQMGFHPVAVVLQ
jgi:hypothetical protein